MLQYIRGYVVFILVGAAAQLYADAPFRHLSVSEGLASAVVYSAMQDSKGFIWFCTETGVSRFDGSRFVNFDIGDGLADNENFKCFEDSRQRIWFASANGHVCYYFKGKFYNEYNTPALKLPVNRGDEFLFDIAEDGAGNIYFSGHWHGIMMYNGKSLETLPLPANLTVQANMMLLNENGMIRAISEYNGYSYLISEQGKLLRKIENDNFSRPVNGYVPRSAWKYQAEDTFYHISDTGIMRYHHSHMQLLYTKKQLRLYSDIQTVLFEHEQLWIGTVEEGLRCYNRKTLNTGNSAYTSFLEGKCITSLLRDREGNLWATVRGAGVYVIRAGVPWFKQMTNEPLYAVFRDSSGIIFTGTADGINILYPDGKRRYISLSNNEKRSPIKQFLPAENGLVYAVTDDFIVPIQFNGTVKTDFKKHLGIKNAVVTPGGVVWIAGPNTITRLKQKQTDPWLYDNSGIRRLIITAIGTESDTDIYFGGKRLYRMSLHSKQIDTLLSWSQLGAGITDIKAAGGLLWVATNGNGVFVIRNNRIFRHLTARQSGLTSNVCTRLHYQRGAWMWIVTNRGLSAADMAMLKVCAGISANEGLPGSAVSDIYAFGDTMYFVTAAGLSCFSISSAIRKTLPPHVVITGMEWGKNRIQDPDSITEVTYHGMYITVTFASPVFHYGASDAVIYRYAIGDTSAWTELKSTTLQLGMLDPGTHTLYLSAKKYNSDWGPVSGITIRILPRFWQTWWFKAILILSVIGLVTWMFWLRISRVRSTARERVLSAERIAQLEGKALGNQMNPHFVFNSLNTLQSYIVQKDVDGGVRYLNAFAALIRKILEHSKFAKINLEDEVMFLTQYVQLEQMRFSHRFSYRIHVDEVLLSEGISLPPMLIQPLIENAIIHGFEPDMVSADISVVILKEGNRLKISVEDNGIGFLAGLEKKRHTAYGSHALEVIRQRLELMTPQPGSLDIIDKKQEHTGSGTIVQIYIPIQ